MKKSHFVAMSMGTVSGVLLLGMIPLGKGVHD